MLTEADVRAEAGRGTRIKTGTTSTRQCFPDPKGDRVAADASTKVSTRKLRSPAGSERPRRQFRITDADGLAEAPLDTETDEKQRFQASFHFLMTMTQSRDYGHCFSRKLPASKLVEQASLPRNARSTSYVLQPPRPPPQFPHTLVSIIIMLLIVSRHPSRPLKAKRSSARAEQLDPRMRAGGTNRLAAPEPLAISGAGEARVSVAG
jgi:hypothetical protein